MVKNEWRKIPLSFRQKEVGGNNHLKINLECSPAQSLTTAKYIIRDLSNLEEGKHLKTAPLAFLSHKWGERKTKEEIKQGH